MDFELFNKVASISESMTKKLAKTLEDESKGVKEIMVKSFIGLMVDSLCDEFNLNENETWEQLYNAHKYVNETEGDFHN
jgi:hypothetical protein